MKRRNEEFELKVNGGPNLQRKIVLHGLPEDAIALAEALSLRPSVESVTITAMDLHEEAVWVESVGGRSEMPLFR